jgi:hypothetical protein
LTCCLHHITILIRLDGCDLINRFNPPHFWACPKLWLGFPPCICHGLFFMFNESWWEVIVCFVDINIGGIVDHHCLNFVFVMITCHTLTSQSVIHCSFSEGVSFNLLISSSILRNPNSFSGSSGSLVGAFWRNSSNLVTWKKHVIFQISFS